MTAPAARAAALRAALFLAPCFLLITAAGCRAPQGELLEAELRDRECQIAELKHELDRKDVDVRTLQLEIDRLQRHRSGKDVESAGLSCALKRVVLGRMTGGHDADPACPGDEGILVVLEPHDADDQSVKAIGDLHVEAYEINPQGLKSALSAWELPAGELRKHWDNPVLGSPAYRVPLAWQRWPATERLRVVALFTTSDGQRYEVDKDITVRPPGGGVRRAGPAKLPRAEPSGPMLPAVEELLPPPRPLPPAKSAADPHSPEHSEADLSPASFQSPTTIRAVQLGAPIRNTWTPQGP